MSDPIDRQAAIETAVKMFKAWYGGSVLRDREIRARFDALPSAQPEIIRCKDCKHHHRDNSGAYYCGRKDYGYGWGLNDFCSDAERRTDETD